MDANLERFKSEVGPFISYWESIDLRVIAGRVTGKWVFGAMRAVLDSSPPSMLKHQDLPTVDGLLVVHERLAIGELDGLLQQLSEGVIRIQGEEIFVQNPNQNPLNYSFQRTTRRDAQQRLAVGSYALYLSAWSGNSIIDDYREKERVESSLRSGVPPWDGLPDLLRNFLGISPNFLSPIPGKVVEVIAPIALNIANASLDGNNVAVTVQTSPKIDSAQIALSVIGHFDDNSQERKHVDAKSIIKDSQLRFEVSFSREPLFLIAILTYRGLDVDRAERFGRPRLGKNARLAAILQQEELDAFLASLKEEKDKFFEDRVAILFHILGLSPGHYGRVSQDNPDILAFPDSDEWVLDVECTERGIDLNNKLSKLATRTKLLAANMPSVRVHPVLVTKFPRVLLNHSEKDKARTEGISIVTSDDFEHLLKMAIEGTSQEAIRDYIAGLVPQTPFQPLGQGGLGGTFG